MREKERERGKSVCYRPTGAFLVARRHRRGRKLAQDELEAVKRSHNTRGGGKKKKRAPLGCYVRNKVL